MTRGEELVQAQDYAKWMVLRIVRDEEDARDVLQTATVKALVALREGRFRGDCSLKTWFSTIAQNEAKMVLRGRLGAKGTRQFLSFDEGDGAEVEQLRSEEVSPLERVVQGEVVARVRHAIARLSPLMREEAGRWLAGDKVGADGRRKARRHHARVRLRELLSVVQ